MYLMYVDESGDIGMKASPTQYFVLSGVVVHELRWQPYLDQLIQFRRRMQDAFSLRLREEIHAAAFISKPGPLVRIQRNDRLAIIRFFANELASMQYLNIINVVVNKAGKPQDYDVFANAWRALLQRFENTIDNRNFPDRVNAIERGIIFPDTTDVKKLTQLFRQMRRYNPVPNQPSFGSGYRNLQVSHLIEDPNFRESQNSYFIQAADLAAFLVYQKFCPSSYIQKRNAQNYFDRLAPILCKFASKARPNDGIVLL